MVAGKWMEVFKIFFRFPTDFQSIFRICQKKFDRRPKGQYPGLYMALLAFKGPFWEWSRVSGIQPSLWFWFGLSTLLYLKDKFWLPIYGTGTRSDLVKFTKRIVRSLGLIDFSQQWILCQSFWSDPPYHFSSLSGWLTPKKLGAVHKWRHFWGEGDKPKSDQKWSGRGVGQKVTQQCWKQAKTCPYYTSHCCEKSIKPKDRTTRLINFTRCLVGTFHFPIYVRLFCN